MTTSELKQQLNNMRTTLRNEEARLVESLNRVIGCEMLCERLIGAVPTIDDTDISTEEAPDNAEHQTD